ncbi:glycoside hydrolase family 16 protein [Hyaloscypha variabilis F]|uniref:Glycoside hydrolase family 16 protein n=1 Tax=Hyaloscypha variabilis (strain UAMH 11265 / GT02V1 / F) TaxID=1149755 RepID=A0A2J6S1W9_HYAVF|nr:glycoside hydrolase family 16 protein [Hyaloscypha variabilis F]
MFVFILLILSCTISAQNTVGSTCTGFTTNGLANSTFLYYRLYDFRNIYNTRSASTQNSITSKTVTNSSWTNDWYIRNYPRKSSGAPDIPVSFTPRRVSITNSTDKSPYYSTYLTLSSARINESTQEGGEITFDEFNVSYASIRVLGRVKGTPGACAGIFTYLNDTEESDIEMFTRDPANFVHYSNQPSSTGAPDWLPIPGATVNVSMPDGMYWTDWHVHRLDWTPGRSVFFVDDIQRNTTTLQVPVADPPSGVYIDMWGANSTWVGSMPIGGEATFEIQWVELLFNTSVSSPAAPAENQKLCAIGDDKISWGLRLASMCSKSLALWSILVVLIVNY